MGDYIEYDEKVFMFDNLSGPHVYQLIPPWVVEHIHQFVISPKGGNSEAKIKHIDEVLSEYGFKRFAAGTNRLVYKYYEDTSFCLKVAFNKTGMPNNADEFKNQNYLKPFVNKIFSVSACGTIATCERVTPIRSREEFAAIADDIFDVTAGKFVGEYLLEDIGTMYFKNWGVREGFGPVLLDYPYLYITNGENLYCNNINEYGVPCGGQIDYDDGFNYLYCQKCKRRHRAKLIGKAIDERQILIGGKGKMMMDKFNITISVDGKTVRNTKYDKPPMDTHIPAKEVEQKKKGYQGKGPSYGEIYDIIAVDCGIKLGRNKITGKWEKIGIDKHPKKGSVEDPYAGVVRKLKPERKVEDPDWIKEANTQFAAFGDTKTGPDMTINTSSESKTIVISCKDLGKPAPAAEPEPVAEVDNNESTADQTSYEYDEASAEADRAEMIEKAAEIVQQNNLNNNVPEQPKEEETTEEEPAQEEQKEETPVTTAPTLVPVNTEEALAEVQAYHAGKRAEKLEACDLTEEDFERVEDQNPMPEDDQSSDNTEPTMTTSNELSDY
jgi:hypothetical protein